ncbi:FAD-dependent monooxygenase [Aurantimonas sp. C2-6-R+9]|uniref:FAD-dependent oxidoreductase n=1 Tax=unclassified Aurantimonas TaxID=2638230 RepID=UPI002E18177B|nr:MULTISPECIES: FAD-dependent monooxygenase [unclassified Aurantimonas]MEC5290031.1 FAD-dependent monooxygenase [Aurantimonas sp. C2-3-R2]MEC5381795.1 FAD-dependent monooxygenase [Aurantimonas sp. C2-6-R+9]MEC5411096.1 FAD-dependent monooxygenase [Aurantimonas sp. C2-4-R8]
MTRPERVLIVGAGPVGLAAAVEFRRRGFHPRIIDSGEGPTDAAQSRALGILPTTLDILTASGIADRLLAEGGRIENAEISLDGKRLFRISTKPARTRHNFILTLPQGRTERLMIEWLAAHDVTVEWNTAFVSLADTHAPRVSLSNGETVAADLVLGADGVHSAVREDVGIPWSGEGYPAEFALADVVFERPVEASTARANLRTAKGGHGGAVALLPLSATTGRYVGIAPSTDALLAGIEGITSITWESRFSVSFRHAERMAKGRVFLAGDAAHVHSPVGGRGMNLGIWDAGWLAYLASEGRQSEYEMRRLPSVRRVLKDTRQMTDVIAAPSANILNLLRYAMPLATQLPWVRRKIAERLLALDLPQPEWL